MKRQPRFSHVYPPNSCGQRGTLLIVVMWIAFGLAAMAILFGHSMMLEYRVADNATAQLEAEQAIEGAQRYVHYILANLASPGQMPDPTTYQAEQVNVGNAYFWLIGRNDQAGTRVDKPAFGLVDEASKLNLNTATAPMLEGLPGMTPQLAGSVINWRAADPVDPNGAPASAYTTRAPSYNCKLSPFETVEELHLVMDMDMTLLFGEDANRNGFLDPNENDGNKTPPLDNTDGKLDPGLLEYVTCYSHDPTGKKGLINVITASATVLSCIVGPVYAQQLIAYRRGKTTDDLTKDMTWVGQVLSGAGMSANSIAQIFTTKSYQFSADVAAVGHDGRGFRRTLFVVDTSSGQPVTIYRRDLTRLGWALGQVVYDQVQNLAGVQQGRSS